MGRIFAHGRSQAVRLPKEFRMPGTAVRVSRSGRRVILEPMEAGAFDVAAWRGSLREAGAGEFLPEGRPPPPEMPDGPSFD